MFKRVVVLLFFVAGVGIYLMTPGCGNKDDSAAQPNPYNPYNNPYGVNCIPGQPCNYKGGPGIPMLNSPTFSILDYQGSTMQLYFTATSNYVAGRDYSGPVNVTGFIRLNRPCGYNMGGMYGGGGNQIPVNGTLSWWSNYAGAIALVQGQLQSNVGPIIFGSSLIKSGFTPVSQNANGNYLEGQLFIAACNANLLATRQ